MITKDMLISEILEKNPEAIEIMIKYGLHCIGCHGGAFESLEDGCKAHGMDEKEVKEIVEEINGKKESLRISKETLKELKEKLNDGKGLRISGNGSIVQIVDKAEEGDIILESDDVKVFIEKKSVEKLKGKRLNYKDGKFFVE